MRVLIAFLLAVTSINAWTGQPLSRSSFVQVASAGSLLSLIQPSNAVDLPSGVSYTVVKQGQGPKPDIGELAAIRFAAYAGDIKIDDIFESPEPYYTRVGSGGLLKGVEEVLPLMQLGDRWKLTIPVSQFGTSFQQLRMDAYLRSSFLIFTGLCVHRGSWRLETRDVRHQLASPEFLPTLRLFSKLRWSAYQAKSQSSLS